MKMKISFFAALVIAVISISGCKKDKHKDVNPVPSDSGMTNLKQFYKTYGAKTKSYTINGAAGGSFTTEKGTKVRIPANCFTNGSTIVSGEVTILFKDITNKSEMLLSDMGTAFFDGRPMVSGGEFFINALSGDSALQIAPGEKIEIEQPFNGQDADNGMLPMIFQDSIPKQDTIGGNPNGAWVVNQNNNVTLTGSSYIYSLYQFSGGASSGTWCNSDNPYYFNSFTQTSLDIKCSDPYGADVFLVFTDENSMIHVYKTSNNSYLYSYAPEGKKCTVVAIGNKNGKFAASFTPITITSNKIVTVELQETSEEDFINILKTLN